MAILEYIFTIGIIISVVALIIGTIKERKNIRATLGKHGFKRRDLLVIIAILLVFAFIELYFIKPTQLLFFDDAIYQAMALDLIHMGQAWMCNYGTPATCFSGQVYHEPIGLSFNMAIAFLVFGVNRSVSIRNRALPCLLSIFMSFFASLLTSEEQEGRIFHCPAYGALPCHNRMGNADQFRHCGAGILACICVLHDALHKQEDYLELLQPSLLFLSSDVHEGG